MGVIAFQGILVGRYNPIAFAAEGYVLQFIFITFIIFLIYMMGGTILVSRRLGAGKFHEANIAFTQSLLLAVVTGFGLITAALWFFPIITQYIVRLEAPIAVEAYQFLIHLLPFSIFIIINFIGCGFIRGSGDTGISMIISLFTNIINAVLAIGLIYGKWGLPELGLVGMAYATGIGHMAGSILLFIFIFKRKTVLNLYPKAWRKINFPIVKRIVKLGYPITIEQLSWTIALFILNIYAARLGTESFTFHQVILQILELISVIYQGIGLGNITIIGQAIGEGNKEKEWQIHRNSRRIILPIAILTGAACFIFAKPLLALYLPDITNLEPAARVLRLFAIMQIPRSMVIITSSHLRARNDVLWMVKSTTILALFWEVGMGYLLGVHFGFGLLGLWVVVGLDETTKFIWHRIRLAKEKVVSIH